jgi:hypothetical protein
VDLNQVLAVIAKGDIAVLLALILFAGSRRWYVWGWVYDDKVREAEDFKAIAKAQTDNAEAITQQATRALDLAERMQSRRRTSDATT